MSDQRQMFDIEPIHQRPLPERIGAMYRMYGRTDGQRCGDCVHLYHISGRGPSSYPKCDLNVDTGGPGSDWGKSWPACGKWEQREDKPEAPRPAEASDLSMWAVLADDDIVPGGAT